MSKGRERAGRKACKEEEPVWQERHAVASPEPEQQAFRTDDASDEENELPQVRFGKIHAGREFGEGSEKGDQVVAVIEAKPYNDGELHEPEMPNFHDPPDSPISNNCSMLSFGSNLWLELQTMRAVLRRRAANIPIVLFSPRKTSESLSRSRLCRGCGRC